MKPKIIVLLSAAIAVALFLTSCNDDTLHYPDEFEKEAEDPAVLPDFTYNPTDDKMVTGIVNSGSMPLIMEGYLYFTDWKGVGVPGEGKSANVLYRLNPATGNITEVCPDPLCYHTDADCPLFAIDDSYGVVAVNNKIYYRRRHITGIEGSNVLWYDMDVVYDIAKNKTTEIFDHSDVQGAYVMLLNTDKYRFFTKSVVSFTETGEEIFTPCLFRTDLETLETKNLGEIAAPAECYIAAVGDRLYFTDAKVLYSTDFDFKDKTVITEDFIPASALLDGVGGKWFNLYTLSCDGEYIYYGLSDGEGEGYILHRISLDGKIRENLGIEMASYQMTEKYIYYTINDSISIGKSRIRGYAGDEIILTGSEIRRCAHDGSGDEHVFTFEGEYAATRTHSYVLNDGYLYCNIYSYVDHDGDGVYEDGDYVANGDSRSEGYRLLRIHADSGEPYLIEYNG